MNKLDALAAAVKRQGRGMKVPCNDNPAIDCWGAGKQCEKCGWNPGVEAERKNRIREALANDG